MLLSGMAGSYHLDAFLRGSLILWLLHYAALHVAYFGRHGAIRQGRILHLTVAIVLVLAALGLLMTDEERTVVASYIVVIAGSVFILGALWIGLIQSRNQDQGSNFFS
jgi:hypothetical protein